MQKLRMSRCVSSALVAIKEGPDRPLDKSQELHGSGAIWVTLIVFTPVDGQCMRNDGPELLGKNRQSPGSRFLL